MKYSKLNKLLAVLIVIFLSLLIFYFFNREIKQPTYSEELKIEEVKINKEKTNLNNYIEKNEKINSDEIINFHFNSGSNFIEWENKNASNATFSPVKEITISKDEEKEIELNNKKILVSFVNQLFAQETISFIKTVDLSFQPAKQLDIYINSFLSYGPFITATDSNILSVKQIKKLKGEIVEITLELLEYNN